MRLRQPVRLTLAVALAGAVVGLSLVVFGGVAFARPTALEVDPGSGEVGTTFTATARGFRNCEQVEFRWVDPALSAGTADANQDGVGRVDIKVPFGFAVGLHVLQAQCSVGDTTYKPAFQDFLVVDVPPHLVLTPREGKPGTPLTAVATGFGGCFQPVVDGRPGESVAAGTVILSWRDTGVPAIRTRVVGGGATANMSVPGSFTNGSHVLVATCESRPQLTAEETFDVIGAGPADSPERLRLSPGTAGPATGFTAEAEGYECEEVEFLWDGRSLGSRPAVDGSSTARLAVPKDAGAGVHRVEARCSTDVAQSDEQEFLVTAAPGSPTPPSPTHPVLTPTLRLSAYAANRGDAFTAAASGYDCADVSFWWDGARFVRTSPVDGGTAVARIRVPGDLSFGRHDFVARCADDATRTARRAFTVVPPPHAPEVLRLSFDTGEPGSRFTATAAGFDCVGKVLFRWDGDPLAASPVVRGIAEAHLAVPEEAAPGRHRVAAVCATDDSERAAGWFTVQTLAPASDLTSYWPAAAALLVLLAAGLPGLRLHRQRRWVHDHLGVQAAAAAGAGMTTSESPENPAARDVEVRIEPHSGSGTQSIEDVEE